LVKKAVDALEWLAAMTSHISFKSCLGEEEIYQGVSISSSCNPVFEFWSIQEDFKRNSLTNTLQ
jgi:hypothetical protein